ncbi:hypothetical protein P3S67_025094 [Capsicum chacoense]
MHPVWRIVVSTIANVKSLHIPGATTKPSTDLGWMDPPQVESMDISTKNYPPIEDDQDKIVDQCCSCFYDCMDSLLEYLCCYDFWCS